MFVCYKTNEPMRHQLDVGPCSTLREEEKMRFIDVVSAAVAVVLAVSATDATAQSQQRPQPACAMINEMEAKLKEQFNEVQIGYGLDVTSGAMARLYAAPGGATWTIVLMTPRGVACVALFGTAWAPVPERLPLPGDPS